MHRQAYTSPPGQELEATGAWSGAAMKGAAMKLVKPLWRAGSPSFKASLIFSSVAPAVGRITRVGAYNRAGQAWSDDPPHA